MCGIAGVLIANGDAHELEGALRTSVQSLSHRGPDNQHVKILDKCALGHARLSVIDPDPRSNQPFSDATGRYWLVFNGELYNYRELRSKLGKLGYSFITESDTEVLLHLLIEFGEKALEQLNGFFAFAFYDRDEDKMLLSRDRMGIKPLYFTKQGEQFFFASELRSLLCFPIKKELNYDALHLYLQLNYVPAPHTILQHIYKLEPGHLITIDKGEFSVKPYYEIPFEVGNYSITDYNQGVTLLRDLVEEAVKDRLVSDVPLGAFLSGGLDSSIISAVAAKHVSGLHTFSIGYTDNPFFDETHYAESVAKKIGSSHTTFKLSTTDLYQHLDQVLNDIDEPFADSSAVAVNILAELTRKQVTVALSGDGADELFGGYNKHVAEWQALTGGLKNKVVKAGAPLWSALPKSRHSKAGNAARQLDRYATGLKLSAADRYWKWATFLNSGAAKQLINHPITDVTQPWQNLLCGKLTGIPDLNNVLYTDCKLVLPNDMLTKVDSMSMAHNLEVRTPLLDHRIVEFAFSIPSDFKVNKSGRKMILQDAFRNELPDELYNRPKKGFEVPMLDWMKTELKQLVETKYLNRDHITGQGIFNADATDQLKNRLFSGNPGDAHATTWALIVFQHWYEKHMG